MAMPRLTEEALARFGERLAAASPLHADLIAEHALSAESIDVPAVLVGVEAHAVRIEMLRRPIEMVVADVAGRLLVLGSADRVDQVAQLAGLRLNEPEEVADYLRFWCRAALRRTESLVESAAGYQWIPGVASDDELRALADRAAHLVRHLAVGHPARGAFLAEGTVLDQRSLHLRRWRVTEKGHVDEVERVLLMDGVPVPYTIP